MKKIVGFLTIGVFLLIPFIANATLLGTGQLKVSWSGPRSGPPSPNYYADYDGKVESSTFGYTTEWEEIFCVSEDHAHAVETVDFYTITDDLDALLNISGLYQNLAKAAWIADNWLSYLSDLTPTQDEDDLKAEAQKAVWGHVGVPFGAGLSGLSATIYNEASTNAGTDYQTNNWYYAHSPGAGSTRNFQDYLTPTVPAPEPATMLLLGTGLIGIAGLGRKKLFK